MGHLVFGLPEIQAYHLHSRLARKLMTRGHRVTVLAGDPVTFEFYCHQGLACLDAARQPPPATLGAAPLAEFAAIDCRLAGRPETPSTLRRAENRLRRWLPALEGVLANDAPDLVAIAHGRSGAHRLLHFLAVQRGIPVLHLGHGLLPLTTQVDALGIDGDSSLCDAVRRDFRQTQSDETFLAAATSSWLGRAHPPPLARMAVTVPPVLSRALAVGRAMQRGQWQAALHGMTAWEHAHDLSWPTTGGTAPLPAAPYGVVLLQAPKDPRRRLDHPNGVAEEALIRAAREGLRRCDPHTRTIVVRPHLAQLPRHTNLPPDVTVVPPGAAPAAIATAMAVVSVNHPLGLAGILTKTPVLHLGRTPYGIPGISRRTTVSDLPDDLPRQIAEGPSQLTNRFLTKILREHHVWCPPELPDGNGISGIVHRMERRMSGGGSQKPLHYRAGPVWPLSVV